MQRTFVIPRGKHKAFRLPKFKFGKIRKLYSIYLSDTCFYNPDDYSETFVSKIIGFTRLTHNENLHKIFKPIINSWMIGFKSVKYNKGDYGGESIQLYWYYDINGKEFRVPTDFYLTNKERKFKVAFIEQRDNTMLIELMNTSNLVISKIYLPVPKLPKIGYYLLPYFGGKPKAKEEMLITIIEEKNEKPKKFSSINDILFSTGDKLSSKYSGTAI